MWVCLNMRSLPPALGASPAEGLSPFPVAEDPNGRSNSQERRRPADVTRGTRNPCCIRWKWWEIFWFVCFSFNHPVKQGVAPCNFSRVSWLFLPFSFRSASRLDWNGWQKRSRGWRSKSSTPMSSLTLWWILCLDIATAPGCDTVALLSLIFECQDLKVVLVLSSQIWYTLGFPVVFLLCFFRLMALLPLFSWQKHPMFTLCTPNISREFPLLDNCLYWIERSTNICPQLQPWLTILIGPPYPIYPNS